MKTSSNQTASPTASRGRFANLLLLLIDQLAAAGCAVISLRAWIDLSTPVGRLLVQLIGALAEFEPELIRERVRGGLAREGDWQDAHGEARWAARVRR